MAKPKHRPFCLSVKGHVKMLRLALSVTSMTFFILAQAPEPYIVITGFEVTIILFFIILYILRLDRLMKCLFWPLLDIINSIVTTLFLVILSVLALIPETTTFTILGGSVYDEGMLLGRIILNFYGWQSNFIRIYPGRQAKIKEVFALITAVFCIADGALIYRKLLFNPSGPYQKKPAHDKEEEDL